MFDIIRMSSEIENNLKFTKFSMRQLLIKLTTRLEIIFNRIISTRIIFENKNDFVFR